MFMGMMQVQVINTIQILITNILSEMFVCVLRSGVDKHIISIMYLLVFW